MYDELNLNETLELFGRKMNELRKLQKSLDRKGYDLDSYEVLLKCSEIADVYFHWKDLLEIEKNN